MKTAGRALSMARYIWAAPATIVGLGLAMYVEVCGLGPSSSLPTGGWEHSQVTGAVDRH